MTDNFDIYTWKDNQYSDKTQVTKETPEKDFDHYAWNEKRHSVELTEDLGEEKEYEVEYWTYTDDGYDNNYMTVRARSEEEAITKVKGETRLSKDFKIYKR